jgi:6-phosphofructokinase 1
MNAAIRAITRIAYSKNLHVLGFERGWEGLINGAFRSLTPRSVGGIIQLGGTILHTSRSLEFRTPEGIKKAVETLASERVDGLFVVGGNGSFGGALALSKKTDTLMIGVPASIDNDIYGTDETIGFDTALNTAVSEIDKIRDTAISHERVFIVEVMGRARGFLAAAIGLTVGAEIILVPEVKVDVQGIVRRLDENSAKGKRSGIIVAAEGIGDTRKLGQQIEKETGTEVRLSVLGYAQRGGSPTGRSRLIANLFADEAVNLFVRSKRNRIACLNAGKITSIDLEDSCKKKKPLSLDLLKLATVLSS